MVYRPFQVLARQTAGGVITGVDYHDGRGLVPLPQFVPDPATKVSEGFSEDVNEDGFVDPIGEAGPLVYYGAPETTTWEARAAPETTTWDYYY